MIYSSKFPEVKQKMTNRAAAAIIDLLQLIENKQGPAAFNQAADRTKEILLTGKTKEAAPPRKSESSF